MADLPNLDPDHLFGRAALLERIPATWAAGARWISLVGPPGVGKTRLARAVDGSFIDLVSARSNADVITALARMLNVSVGRLDEAAATDRIGRALAGRSDRIILDNLEQLVPAVTPLLTRWMGAAPAIQWLGTLRRALGFSGEVVLPVPGLDAASAIALYRARAWATGVEYAPDTLADIVQQLDGLPLAIELAAARAPSVSLPNLQAALKQDAGVLPPLDAALETAWRLLSPAKQRDLRAVCTFSAAFPIAAADAVLGRPALQSVEQLRAHGWLRRDARGRYRPYVGVRAFVRARSDHPEAAERHARWHGAEGHRLWRALVGPEPVAALNALAEMADDLRTTLESGPPDAMSGAALGLHALANDRGPWQRKTWAIDTALTRGVRGHQAIKLLSLRGLTRAMRGDYATGATDLILALEQAEADGAPDVIAWVLGGLGPVRRFEGRLAEAEALIQRELALAEQYGLDRERARALFNLAGVRWAEGDYGPAEAVWGQARALALRVGHVRAAAVSLANLAITSQRTGAFDEARALHARALAELSAVEMPVMQAKMVAEQVKLALAVDDLDGAAAYIHRGTALAEQLFDDELAVDMAIARAQLAERTQAPDVAASWRAADALAHALAQPGLTARVAAARPTRVDPAGRWLIADGGARIDLDGHPVLQRVLAVLAQAPEPLSVMALFEAAWPDERIQPESAANRVYTAVRALRRAGAAIITRPGRGYVLDHSGGFSHRSGRP